MSSMTRRKALFLLALATISVAILAAALPQLVLQPGQLLPGTDGAPASPPAEQAPNLPSISMLMFFKALIGILFILFMPLLIYGLIKKSPWRRIIRTMAAITGITVLVLALLTLMANRYGAKPELVAEPPVESTAVAMATTPLGSPPSWLVWLVFGGLAALIGGAGIWLIYSSTHQPKDRVAEEAEKAIDALKAGLDLKNVILRCYLQMSVALQQEQGIERTEAMTTREFERLLEARGVPDGPVHDLTRLFEAVRYGRRQATSQDEQTAFTCLNAIIQYSRTERQVNEDA